MEEATKLDVWVLDRTACLGGSCVILLRRGRVAALGGRGGGEVSLGGKRGGTSSEVER